jgi:glucose-1-phosphate thymidylyltransferase
LSLPYPKELYPIIRDNRYKPVSQFILDNLVEVGVEHLVLVINETKHQLIGYFGSGSRFGCTISYVVQEMDASEGQSTSPGLAHALDAAYHLTRDKTVFFGMADTIIQPKDVFKLSLDEKGEPAADVVLSLFTTTKPEKFGMVQLGADASVVRIDDKPKHTDLNYMWGCIVWKPVFTEYLHAALGKRKIYDFAEILNNAVRDGLKMRGVIISNGNFIDLGTYEEILELDRRFRED